MRRLAHGNTILLFTHPNIGLLFIDHLNTVLIENDIEIRQNSSFTPSLGLTDPCPHVFKSVIPSSISTHDVSGFSRRKVGRAFQTNRVAEAFIPPEELMGLAIVNDISEFREAESESSVQLIADRLSWFRLGLRIADRQFSCSEVSFKLFGSQCFKEISFQSDRPQDFFTGSIQKSIAQE